LVILCSVFAAAAVILKTAMNNDSELLRRYAEGHDENAFAEVVRRHLALVYHAAVRQCRGDTHRAQDVAQMVFTDLARKAGRLSRRPVLAGWLYTSTRYAALQTIRTEARRQAREQEAVLMDQIPNTLEAAADWEQLRPVIDDALHALGERDREAVLLRYFEGQGFAEVGRRLNLSEDATRMRVDRALAKMRATLARHGVSSTTTALSVALAGQATAALPAGLTTSVTGFALTGAAEAGATIFGILGFMSTTKLTAAIAVVGLLAGIGTAYLGTNAAKAAQVELAGVRERDRSLSARLLETESALAVTARRLAAGEDTYARLTTTVRAFSLTSAAEPPREAEPITADLVSRRFKRVQELVRQNGDPAEALRELLWCYDIGMPRILGMGAVRTTSLMLFGELGKRYPPALEVLRERREKARELMLSNEREHDATQEYSSINRALGDYQASLAILEDLPAGDRRRRSLAYSAYDYLVKNRRYGEALEGRPYSSINASFENYVARTTSADTAMNTFMIESTATSIEVLAGSGDLDQARALVRKLLAHDSSEGTRALIQTHLQRAGQPTLLSAPTAGENQP